MISTAFLIVLVLAALLSLFVVKLRQIQKNKTINAFIHRQTVLTALTLLFNAAMLCALSVAVVRCSNGEPFYYGTGLVQWAQRTSIALLVTLSNFCHFLCIAISYRCCDSLIVLCFGYIRCCRVVPITTAEHDAIFLEQIMRNEAGRSDRSDRAEGPQCRVQLRTQSAGSDANAPLLPAIAAGVQFVGHLHVIGGHVVSAPTVSDYDIIYEY